MDDWIVFRPGEEPTVLTEELCARFGCERCPGHMKAGDIGVLGDPEAPVFCTHWCHMAPLGRS